MAFLRKKWWLVIPSLLLMLPAQILLLLFVAAFDSLTGCLMLGYGIGCVVFGLFSACPILIPLAKEKTITVKNRWIFSLLSVAVCSLLLFFCTALA